MKSFYHRITGSTLKFVRTRHFVVAGVMLAGMAVLGLGSMMGNSAITDEVAHVPAAYSYVHYGDYRLNPEHPPLIKDLAGIPLQFLHLKFPENLPAWKDEVNGQWETGWNFLYHVGNNADQILFWARLPILLLALGFGWVLYGICRRRWGTGVALLSLFFYVLSPNIIAHSLFVTTDLGASVFMFLAVVAFARFVDAPTRRNTGILSLALAGAQLAKFSAVILYPFFGLLALGLALWVLPKPVHAWERIRLYVGGLIGASALSVVWIWIFYAPQVWRMPVAIQDQLIEKSLYGPNVQGIGHMLMAVNNVPLMEPLVQYLTGLTMVFTRVSSGNVTYFNGEVTDKSFHTYFPELVLLKTQVAFLILLVVIVGLVVWQVLRHRQRLAALAPHIRSHMLEWMLAAFTVMYFAVSVAGNLNLGIRHVLPIYVPIFVLVAIATVAYMRRFARREWKQPARLALVDLLVWYGGSTVLAFPNYLSYFNELIGGGQHADAYFSDSSVDWGQDLRRLKQYVDQHPEINHLAIDYFGGGVPAYYFCPRKYGDDGRIIQDASGYDCSKTMIEVWHSQYGQYTNGYIAVSETFLENDRYYAVKNGTPGYGYLRSQVPVAKIGNSIYLFKVE